MRCSTRNGNLWLAMAALIALGALSGCGDDDTGPVGTPVPTSTRTSTRTSGPTATATPLPVAGDYAGALDLGDGETAEVEISVEANGDAEALVLLPDPTEASAPSSGSAAAILSLGMLGQVNTSTGAFQFGGTFNGAGEPVTVSLTGILPGPGRDGTMTLTVNGETYSGPLGVVVPPTQTPGPDPTATATGAMPNPTFTATPGVGETPTPGLIAGISTDFLGVWVGRAVNESTGDDRAARLRVAVEGGNVVITDLNGNIFRGGSSINMTVRTSTALSYNAFGPPVVVFTVSLPGPNNLVALYGVTTPAFPPVIESLAMNLTKE
jgi:hypothetical protein